MAESQSSAAVSQLASRSGCLGLMDIFLAVLIDFFRQLARAGASFTTVYQSRRTFLGLPWIHVNVGFDNPDGKPRQARGILAIGNYATGALAFGLIFARGLFAIALVAVGVVAVSIAGFGLLSVSAGGLGAVSVSVLGAGYLAVGIMALGWQAVGIVAVGQKAVGIIGLGREVHALFSP